MNYIFTKNAWIALLAIALASCVSSQDAENIESLISPSSESEVATTTEPQETEDIPQSSPNSEENEPKTITQSSSGITPQQLNRRVKQFTVRIDGASNGSGVIIDESDNTYTVLTNWHVVEQPGEYKIQTADGREHQVDYQQVEQLAGVDLALVKFTSEENYQTAKVGDSDYLSEGQPVHLAGYPGVKTNNDRIYRFYNLNIVSLLDTPINKGYSVLYEGETISGMSGSPLLDNNGDLVGIHGIYRVDDPAIRKGSSYAIPINTYKELVAEKPEPTDTVASQPSPVVTSEPTETVASEPSPVATKKETKAADNSTTVRKKQVNDRQTQTIPEISWKSSLSSFGLNKEENLGKQFSFKCSSAPTDLSSSIWGSDNYTTDSPICPSGVHAGIITRDGGIVTLKLDPGQSFYTGSQRNGITTRDYGAYDTSFSFVSNSVATKNQQSQSIPEISWKSSPNSFGLNKEGNIGKKFSFKCSAAPAEFRSSVWGNNDYTTGSYICPAGVHAGVITKSGGTVTLQLNPGQPFHTGIKRNGISSNDNSATDISFSFVK